MKILIIGGTRFVGRAITEKLSKSGHEIYLLNRGHHKVSDDFPAVKIIYGDIQSPLITKKIEAFLPFDAIIHTIAYTPVDIKYLKPILLNSDMPLIFISTGQTYLVTVNKSKPFTELAYFSEICPAPQKESDYQQWLYGIHKRDVEDNLQQWYNLDGITSISLRCPVLHGFHDYSYRLYSYLARMLDGGPLILPPDDHSAIAHMWVQDLASAIEILLKNPPKRREVYNLSGDFSIPLPEFLAQLQKIGNTNSNIYFLKNKFVHQYGDLILQASPFSGRWVSVLDAEKFKTRYGWKPTPIEKWLPEVVRFQIENFNLSSLKNYKNRNDEIRLVQQGYCVRPEEPKE